MTNSCRFICHLKSNMHELPHGFLRDVKVLSFNYRRNLWTSKNSLNRLAMRWPRRNRPQTMECCILKRPNFHGWHTRCSPRTHKTVSRLFGRRKEKQRIIIEGRGQTRRTRQEFWGEVTGSEKETGKWQNWERNCDQHSVDNLWKQPKSLVAIVCETNAIYHNHRLGICHLPDPNAKKRQLRNQRRTTGADI